MSQNTCPNCGSDALISDKQRGEVICSNCGLVVSRIIDSSPEWRAFDAEEKAHRSRAGSRVSPLQTDFGVLI